MKLPEQNREVVVRALQKAPLETLFVRNPTGVRLTLSHGPAVLHKYVTSAESSRETILKTHHNLMAEKLADEITDPGLFLDLGEVASSPPGDFRALAQDMRDIIRSRQDRWRGYPVWALHDQAQEAAAAIAFGGLSAHEHDRMVFNLLQGMLQRYTLPGHVVALHYPSHHEHYPSHHESVWRLIHRPLKT